MWIPMGITALVAMLLVMVEHWLPWKEMLGKMLPRPAAYILGTLAILGPLTVLLSLEVLDWWQTIMAMWLTAAAAGAGTILSYAVDHWLAMRSRLKAAESEAKILRAEDGDGPNS